MMIKGLQGRADTVVTKNLLASRVGSGEADVFATPMMAALMEKAASESLKPYLPEGKTSVGISLHIAHTVINQGDHRNSLFSRPSALSTLAPRPITQRLFL